MKKILGAASALLMTSALLTGCATSNNSSGGSGGGSNTAKVKVVTSTDVYADLVKQVGGDNVDVHAFVSSTATDPHSYEASASDKLQIKDAKLAVVNGGGYDYFLEKDAGQNNQKVVNAVKTSGKLSDADYDHLIEHHSGGEGHVHNLGSEAEEGGGHEHAHEFNEHLWYDFDTVKKVTNKIADDLAEIDSSHADQYRENAKKLTGEIDSLEESAKKISGKGKKYIATEPVPDYLISSTGAENSTPAEFAEAVEEGKDVPAITLQETKDLVTEKKVNLVAYNSQTETSQTKEVLQSAKDSGVANVSFTETLPENTKYVDWMKSNVSNLEKALS